MATNILMPALSPTMTEGTLARWLKKEGEQVQAGDVIAEIETDKATMEVEAVDEGTLGKILVADGTTGVKVNAPIAVLVEEGEDVPDQAASAEQAPKEAPKQAEPEAKQAGPEQAAPEKEQAAPETKQAAPETKQRAPKQEAGETGAPAALSAGGNGEAQKSQPAAPPPAPRAGSNGQDTDGERVFASPLARRMAKQAGIDLSGLKGTGPNGRIVKADIEAAQKGVPAAAAETPEAGPEALREARPGQAQPPPVQAPTPAAPPPAITAPHTLVPNSSMRKVIAARLTSAKQTIPHFYVSMDVELDALLKLRAELNARSAKDGPAAFKLSVNDLLIKAAAVALRRVPKVNASWTEQAIALYEDVDISVAVSIPDGLITPIIRKADQKGLAAISAEMKGLAERARAGKLKPEEFQGGGFSISNMGMYGVSEFGAIINPPQAAILAVAAGQQRSVVKDGALAIATMMTCTLSVDHRVVDGALGAEWLGVFKSIVEDPLSLML